MIAKYMKHKGKRQAIAYLRTSSAVSGTDKDKERVALEEYKDSDERQRAGHRGLCQGGGRRDRRGVLRRGGLRCRPRSTLGRASSRCWRGCSRTACEPSRRDRQPLRPRPDGSGDRLRHAEGARHRADRRGQARCLPRRHADADADPSGARRRLPVREDDAGVEAARRARTEACDRL